MSSKLYHRKEKELLDICLQRIEGKLQWPPSDTWRNSHFELLSEKIFEETHVQLSTVTLKRLWGKVAYQSLPASSTLDALAKYLGHENWIYFQQEANKIPDPESDKTRQPQVLSLLQGNKVAIGLGILAFFVLLTLMASTARPDELNLDEVSFEFDPVTTGVPNTVIFRYHAQGSKADSAFIQQSWNPRLRKQVDLTGNIHTSTYYYPGFYIAKLLLNDKIVVEKELHIKSPSWVVTIEQDPVPFYLTENEFQGEGVLAITPEHLRQRGYDLNASMPLSSFHLVKDFGEIPATDFRLKTTFKHTLKQGETICQKSRIVILCTKTPFLLPFSIPGCVGELDLYIPGKNFGGDKNDLSGFGVDFSDWIQLEVSVENRQVEIAVNEHVIFQDSLAMDPGRVVGLRYKFHGTGAIKDVQIDAMGKTAFSSDFYK